MSQKNRIPESRLITQPQQNTVGLKLCWPVAFVLILVCVLPGCGTTTQRLATEQLLLSDAVDQAINQIDFQYLGGQSVYLDTKYLKPVQGAGPVNSDYIISSLRQQLTAANCLIQDSRDDADIVVEPRVGALGTDGHEVTYGIPQSKSISSAASAFSGAPTPIPIIPEISFGRNDALSGIAKIIVFAYDRETKQPLWQSGIAKAESNSSSTWVLGAGPFQKGTIYEGLRFAGKPIEEQPSLPTLHAPPILLGLIPDSFSGEPVEPENAEDSTTPKGPLMPQIQFSDVHVFRQLQPVDPASDDDAVSSDAESLATADSGNPKPDPPSDSDENVIQTGYVQGPDE